MSSIFIYIQQMHFQGPPDVLHTPGLHNGMAEIGERNHHVVFHLPPSICGNFLNHPHWSAADVVVIKLQAGQSLSSFRSHMVDITVLLQKAPCPTSLLKRIDKYNGDQSHKVSQHNEHTEVTRHLCTGRQDNLMAWQPIQSPGRQYLTTRWKILHWKRLVEVNQGQLLGKYKRWCYHFKLDQNSLISSQQDVEDLISLVHVIKRSIGSMFVEERTAGI